MAGADERIDVEVALENNLSRPAKVAEKSLDSLGDEATQVAGQMALLDESMEDVSQQALVLGANAKYAQETLDGMGDSSKYSAKGMKEHASSTKKAKDEQEKYAKSLDKTLKSMLKLTRLTKLFRFALKGILVGGIIDGITFLVTAIQGLSAALVAAVNGLGRMSGVLGAMPSLFASVIQGALTFKVGIKGMGDALKALGDPDATLEEINAAMKDLAPSARGVVKELFALKGGWDVLQRSVQQRLFAGLADDVRMLGAKYLPILRSNMEATADSLNSVMGFTSRWLRQGQNVRAVNSVMKDNSFIVGQLGYAFSELFRATIHFMDAAGPMAKRMSADLASWVSTIANKIQNNKKGIGQWLMGSYETWLNAKDALVDYGAAFFNIFKAATPMSKWMGKHIARIGREFRQWTESKEGRKDIRQWFKDMRPVVKELALWVRDLSKFFAGIAMDPDVFVPISQQMREDLLPALEKIFKAMSGNVLPAIIELFEAFGELADAGLLEVFAKALLILAKALKAIAWAFNKMPDWAQNIIIWGGAIAFLGRTKVMRGLLGFVGKSGVLSRFGAKLASLLRGPMAKFAGWFEKVFGSKTLTAVKKLLGPIGKLAGKFAMFAAPGLFLGGKNGKGTSTTGTGVPPVVGGLPGGDDDGKTKTKGKSRLGRGTRSALRGGGGLLGSAALWLGLPPAVGAAKDYFGGAHSVDTAGDRMQGADPQEVYKALKATPVAEHADDLNYNLKELAVSISKYGSESPYWKELREGNVKGGTNWTPEPWTTDIERENEVIKSVEPIMANVDKMFARNKNIESTLDSLDKLPGTLQGIAREAAKSAGALNGLPKQVKTSFMQPGMVENLADVNKLREEYDLTPKQVKTLLKAMGVEATIRDVNNARKSAESFEGTYTAKLQIKRIMDNIMQSIYPWGNNFAGGQVGSGEVSWVGELGPEAFVSNTGKIGMVGEHGPELRKFGQGGAIIPSSATFDPAGNTGNAPGWAVNAFRKATEDGMGSVAIQAAPSPQKVTEEVHYHYHQTGDVHNAQPIDMQQEFKKAFRAMERDRKERR